MGWEGDGYKPRALYLYLSSDNEPLSLCPSVLIEKNPSNVHEINMS